MLLEYNFEVGNTQKIEYFLCRVYLFILERSTEAVSSYRTPLELPFTHDQSQITSTFKNQRPQMMIRHICVISPSWGIQSVRLPARLAAATCIPWDAIWQLLHSLFSLLFNYPQLSLVPFVSSARRRQKKERKKLIAYCHTVCKSLLRPR